MILHNKGKQATATVTFVDFGFDSWLRYGSFYTLAEYFVTEAYSKEENHC